jgi:hypothetical protein
MFLWTFWSMEADFLTQYLYSRYVILYPSFLRDENEYLELRQDDSRTLLWMLRPLLKFLSLYIMIFSFSTYIKKILKQNKNVCIFDGYLSKSTFLDDNCEGSVQEYLLHPPHPILKQGDL